MSTPVNQPSFTKTENFSLTHTVASKLANADSSDKIRNFTKICLRTLGAVSLPIMGIVDAVVHAFLFLGKLILGLVLLPYNFIGTLCNIKQLPKDLTLTSSFVHLTAFFEGAIQSLTLGIVVVFSPQKAAALSQRSFDNEKERTNCVIEELQNQLKALNEQMNQANQEHQVKVDALEQQIHDLLQMKTDLENKVQEQTTTAEKQSGIENSQEEPLQETEALLELSEEAKHPPQLVRTESQEKEIENITKSIEDLESKLKTQLSDVPEPVSNEPVLTPEQMRVRDEAVKKLFNGDLPNPIALSNKLGALNQYLEDYLEWKLSQDRKQVEGIVGKSILMSRMRELDFVAQGMINDIVDEADNNDKNQKVLNFYNYLNWWVIKIKKIKEEHHLVEKRMASREQIKEHEKAIQSANEKTRAEQEKAKREELKKQLDIMNLSDVKEVDKTKLEGFLRGIKSEYPLLQKGNSWFDNNPLGYLQHYVEQQKKACDTGNFDSEDFKKNQKEFLAILGRCNLETSRKYSTLD